MRKGKGLFTVHERRDERVKENEKYNKRTRKRRKGVVRREQEEWNG